MTMEDGPERPFENADLAVYWDGIRSGLVRYQVCKDCNSTVFHPRAICPYCTGNRLDYRDAAGTGTIYSASVLYYPIDTYHARRLPYALGIIHMTEDFYMFAELTPADPTKLRIGAPVKVWFDRIDEDLTLPKFTLVE